MLSHLTLSVEMDIFEVFSGLLFSHLQNKWNCPNDYLFNSLSSFQTNSTFFPLIISHHAVLKKWVPTPHSNDNEDLFLFSVVIPYL